MLDPDNLVATRSRRANAGANLRRLIEIEEQSTGLNNIVYTGDDENVELLFQEDENDVEFEESASEDGENSAEESQGEGEGTPDADPKAEAVESDQNVNSDEMLSDSDLSASDNDDSEGERDLQKRERENKRKKKPQSIIPTIKKPRLQEPKPKPQQPQTIYSELLLTHDRRASSRKSALKNKETLVKKLKEDETRRAALAPVVRVKERKLTQEERLAQAVETERENVKSLHSFLEQEIVKKERQKLLFQQRRIKLRDVVRLSSKLTYVTPLDEIDDTRYVHNVIEKKKNKGRRRRTITETVEEVALPGAIDTSLPYYREEMEKKRQQEEAEMKKIQEEEAKVKMEQSEDVSKSEKDPLNNSEAVSVEEKDEETRGASKTLSPEVEIVNSDDMVIDKVESTGVKSDIKYGNDVTIDEDHTTNQETFKIDDKSDSPNDPEVQSEATEKSLQECSQITADSEIEKKQTETETLVDTEGSAEPEVKNDTNKEIDDSPLHEELDEAPIDKVKADTPKTELDSEAATVNEEAGNEAAEEAGDQEAANEEEVIEEAKEEIVLRREDTDGSIFEGPPQLVSRNYVSLIEFEGERLLPLANSKVKVILFGEGANSGASRRLRDVKTILKSSLRSDNPYSAPKEEKEDELMKPVTEIDEEDSIFEALRRIPRLGTKEIFEELEEDDQKEEATAIEIRTEAPTGLYLPNGNKKLCLINGKEVRYFDPATGIPYDNKDGYQIIKSIESGNIPWLSLGKDQNTYGEVEIYLNKRDGARHAKGVPEGFDGF